MAIELMASALSGWYETCLRGSEFGARKMCPANLARLSSNSREKGFASLMG